MPRKPKKQDSTKKAFVATFFSIIGFIISLLAWRKDKYVTHYSKQSLLVFITAVLASVISTIIGWIPILGWIIIALVDLFVVIIWFQSWIYALSNDKKYISIIGCYGDKIRL